MSDQIILEYGARIEQFEASLRQLENKMRGVEATATKSAQSSSNAFNKQSGIINNLRHRIDQLTRARDKSNDPKKIQRYNALLEQSNKRLQSLTANTKKVEKNTNSLGSAAGKLGGILAAVFSVQKLIQFGQHVIQVTGQFQRLEAVLTNTLGSNSAAQRALSQIQVFAARTPFAVSELTESYVKLANQGFKPTQDEMRKLGDLASSTGKQFGQLTEAIIDAQTGEFERLKEFGIRASKEGDRVTFTFKGVKQQVDFTNESIRNYVLGLGDAEGVSGAMASISDTVEGKISNLGDAWDQLALAIGNSNGVIAESVGLLSQWVSATAEFLTPLKEKIRRDFAPQAEKYVEQQKERLKELANEIQAVNGDVATALNFQMEEEQKNLEGLVEYWRGKLKEFEEANSRDDILNSEALAKQRTQILTSLIKSEEYLKSLQDAYRETRKEFEKPLKEPPTQEELDKQFEAELKLLEQQEKFALRRAAIEDATELELIAIQQKYNEQKIELIEDYSKETEAVYEDHIIRRDELEKESHEAWLAMKRKEAEEISKVEKDKTDQLKAELEERHRKSIEYAKAYADAMVEKEKEAAERRKQIQEGFFSFADQLLDNHLESQREKDRTKHQEDIERSDQQAAYEIGITQKKLDAGIISEQKAAAQKEAILQRQQEREANLKRQAWIADRDAAAEKALIDAAAAAVKTLANLGIPAGLIPSAFALAQGAAQSAFIRKRQPPKFREGVIDLRGPGTGTSDSIDARLSRGESVMTAEETREYKPLFKAIRHKKFGKYIHKNYVLPVLQKKAQDRYNFEARKQNTAEQIADSLRLNGLDTLERTIKRSSKNGEVKIKNINELASVIKSGYSSNDL